MSKLDEKDAFVCNNPRLNSLMGVSSGNKENVEKSKRFTLELFPSNEKECPEFDYEKLQIQHKAANGKTSLGFDDSNDDEQLKALAKKFEEKYEYTDIGLGYDESDTFIDNSEAYDEVVPMDWTTEHGGFYINQGELDFRPISDENNKSISVKKKLKKSVKNLKTPKEISTQKKKVQLLTKEKQRKRQESLMKAQKILVKKKKVKQPTVEKKAKEKTTSKEANKSFEDDVPLAAIAAKAPAASKPTSKQKNLDDIPLSKIVDAQLNALKEKVNNEQPAEASAPKVDPPPLPENLSDDVLSIIENLKKIAESCSKGKFFTPEVNTVLLEFAKHCRLFSPKTRNAVYDHVLVYLPCAKDTLAKRCRNLVVQSQRKLEDEPMRKLQEAINKSMVEQKQLYEEEVAKALQEQAREQIKQTGIDPSKTEENTSVESEEKNKKTIPKRKFNWTPELRKLLCDVVQVRVGLYKISKARHMTGEEYVKDFLETDIRRLWPKGWMTSRILFKESRQAHLEITQPNNAKNKKKLEATSASQQPSTTTTITSQSATKITQSISKIVVSTSNQPITTGQRSSTTTTVTTQQTTKVSPQLTKTVATTTNQPLIVQQSSKVVSYATKVTTGPNQEQTLTVIKQQPKAVVEVSKTQLLKTVPISDKSSGNARNIESKIQRATPIVTTSSNAQQASKKLSPAVVLQSINTQKPKKQVITIVDKDKHGANLLKQLNDNSLPPGLSLSISPVLLSKLQQQQKQKHPQQAQQHQQQMKSPIRTTTTPTTMTNSAKSSMTPLLTFTSSPRIAFTTISKTRNTQMQSTSVKPTLVTKTQPSLMATKPTHVVNSTSNTPSKRSVNSSPATNGTDLIYQKRIPVSDTKLHHMSVSTPIKSHATPHISHQKQLFQSSPQVSPFAVTPTLVRSSSQESRKAEQSKQVKRKSIDDDVSFPNKRHVLSYHSPLNTSIPQERSWSDVENDLLRMSRGAGSSEKIRKSPIKVTSLTKTSPSPNRVVQSKNWSPVQYTQSFQHSSHDKQYKHTKLLSHHQYAYSSPSSDNETSPLKHHLPVSHPTSTIRSGIQKQHQHHQQQRSFIHSPPKLHHDNGIALHHSSRRDSVENSSLPSHPSMKLVNDSQHGQQKQHSSFVQIPRTMPLEQASLLFQQQQQQKQTQRLHGENEVFKKQFQSIPSQQSQHHYN